MKIIFYRAKPPSIEFNILNNFTKRSIQNEQVKALQLVCEDLSTDILIILSQYTAVEEDYWLLSDTQLQCRAFVPPTIPQWEGVWLS